MSHSIDCTAYLEKLLLYEDDEDEKDENVLHKWKNYRKGGGFVAGNEIIIMSGYSKWLLPLTYYSGERWERCSVSASVLCVDSSCIEACRAMWSNSHFSSFILLMQIAINKMCYWGFKNVWNYYDAQDNAKKKKIYKEVPLYNSANLPQRTWAHLDTWVQILVLPHSNLPVCALGSVFQSGFSSHVLLG